MHCSMVAIKFVIAAVLAVSLYSADASAHGVSEADKAAMVAGGYIDYVVLGAKHMVTGYDHLLFLFGVMFFLTKFGEIVKFITAFTFGHTITLIGATYAGIQANYFLIDAVIAMTVAYKGFDNLNGFKRFLDVKAPNLLAAVFVFGLIHGFGLSTRLQQLYLPEDGFLLRIISFNIGVELGQIAALTVMLAILSVWRHTVFFSKFSSAANTGLIAAGGLLFMMQMHGFSHTQYPDEFGFPSDNHTHAHELSAQPQTQAEAVHVHEDGSIHPDHDLDSVAGGEGVPGTHTHEDGSVHQDHSAPTAQPQPESSIHVHADGSVHEDHNAPVADSQPESTHVHADGSVHTDHSPNSAPPTESPMEAQPLPGASPLDTGTSSGHTHSHGDGVPHEH